MQISYKLWFAILTSVGVNGYCLSNILKRNNFMSNRNPLLKLTPSPTFNTPNHRISQRLFIFFLPRGGKQIFLSSLLKTAYKWTHCSALSLSEEVITYDRSLISPKIDRSFFESSAVYKFGGRSLVFLCKFLAIVLSSS